MAALQWVLEEESRHCDGLENVVGVRGEKIEAERIDDEEDGAFVGRRYRAGRCGVCARRDGRKG